MSGFISSIFAESLSSWGSWGEFFHCQSAGFSVMETSTSWLLLQAWAPLWPGFAGTISVPVLLLVLGPCTCRAPLVCAGRLSVSDTSLPPKLFGDTFPHADNY